MGNNFKCLLVFKEYRSKCLHVVCAKKPLLPPGVCLPTSLLHIWVCHFTNVEKNVMYESLYQKILFENMFRNVIIFLYIIQVMKNRTNVKHVSSSTMKILILIYSFLIRIALRQKLILTMIIPYFLISLYHVFNSRLKCLCQNCPVVLVFQEILSKNINVSKALR